MNWVGYTTIAVVIFFGWFGWLIYKAPSPVNEPEEHKFDDKRVGEVLDELDRQEMKTHKVRCIS